MGEKKDSFELARNGSKNKPPSGEKIINRARSDDETTRKQVDDFLYKVN